MPTVVITGASQGIGAGIARLFAEEENAQLALIARNRANLEQVEADCRRLGGDPLVIECDVTDPDQVSSTSRTVLDRWGAPDVLVNNAGQFRPGGLLDTPPSTFREQVDVNLNGAFYFTNAFLGPMMKRGSGIIFYTASVASIKAYPGGVAYCAAKHGLLGLARATREETKGSGVRSTALVLGATYTPSWEGAGLPPERFIPVDDVSRVVLQIFRMSDRSVVEEILIRPSEGDI